MTPSDARDRKPTGLADAAAASDREADAVRTAIRAVRRGEVEAFAGVVDRYQRRLFGLALMLTREPAAADELAQDAFVRAFTHLDAYDDRRPFYPWLATIAVRLAQNWLTMRARQMSREGRAIAAGPGGDVAANPLATLIADESSGRLWRAVASLPAGERASAILYYRQEMSVGEIGRALGVSTGTVKTLLFRARRRLRNTVTAAGEDER